ncbi:uncharacterized protein [Prorops nasuta]|uniref:uncharacterized protein n=1 Tax=Prorops nasuta TaxID=863751 RepID=UPI0034D01A6D
MCNVHMGAAKKMKQDISNLATEHLIFGRYYRIAKFFMIVSGQWPPQEKRIKVPLITVQDVIIVVSIITVLMNVVVNSSTESLFESVAGSTLGVYGLVEQIMILSRQKSVRNILISINNDWNNLRLREEHEIMHKFGKRSYFLTATVVLLIIGSSNTFISLPLIIIIMNYVAPLNESRPIPSIIEAEYFVDPVKYQLPIFIHIYGFTYCVVSALLTYDCLIITFIHHSSALFDVAGFYFGKLLYKDRGYLNEYFPETIGYSTAKRQEYIFRRCVKKHLRAIEFADELKNALSLPCLIMLLCNFIEGTAISVYLMEVLGTNLKTLRYTIFLITHVVHHFIFCAPGQVLTDYSELFYYKILYGEWYSLPVKCQKMIVIILRKSKTPCYLSCGKFFILGYDIYAKGMQTMFSYCAMMLSLHKH